MERSESRGQRSIDLKTQSTAGHSRVTRRMQLEKWSWELARQGTGSGRGDCRVGAGLEQTQGRSSSRGSSDCWWRASERGKRDGDW